MKRVVAILLAVLMIIGLAACAGTPTTSTTTKPATSGTTTATTAAVTTGATVPKTAKTIKFLSMWAQEAENSKLILDLTAAYQKDFPNFKIEFEPSAFASSRHLL